MLLKKLLLSFSTIILIFASCTEHNKKTISKSPERKKPAVTVSYHFEKTGDWLSQNSQNTSAKNIIEALNRTDFNNLKKMDTIIVPNDATGDIAFYLPFPLRVEAAADIQKIIFFSYPSQSFAAYENGELIYTGATNMGRKANPTPTGLYFTNWKAEKTISTVDDEWELKWNFNIENKEGIGWHEYELPGYPASHSCLRLQEADAKYLYNWADQWVLQKDEVQLKGTPVVVFGNYDFDAPKPWLKLVSNAAALNISDKDIDALLASYKAEILKEQKKRNALVKK